jgi:phosphoesterase RecJ-like protein
MNEACKLVEVLKKAKSVIIIAHVGPDGDTLGSMLALKDILTQLGTINKIDAVMSGKVPDIYHFLPYNSEVKTSDDKSLYQNYDVGITVDCGSIDRLGDVIDLFRNAKTTVNIDHHISNTKFGQINWIEPKAAACGQMLYKLIKLLGVSLNKNIGINLYTAILTDTGGFKFENTRPETLKVCAELIAAGADHTCIYKKIYESKPLAMVMLQAKAVSSAIFTDNNKISYVSISREFLDSLNAVDDYVDGISETLRQVNTVEVAMVFKETLKGGTKVSFRSNTIDVCEIAKFFGGGGHKLAAGCTVEKNIADTINEILPIIKKQISRLS